LFVRHPIYKNVLSHKKLFVGSGTAQLIQKGGSMRAFLSFFFVCFDLRRWLLVSSEALETHFFITLSLQKKISFGVFMD
jgi:hypothetical protein